MTFLDFDRLQNWILLHWLSLSLPSKILIGYCLGMVFVLLVTLIHSQNDDRTIRDIGIWVKPMKFMAATVLFGLSTVWLVRLANSNVDQTKIYYWITTVIILTSFFEVAYISFQAYQGEQSHYNRNDRFHALMFGLMGLAAVGLISSQIWLAWELWNEQTAKGLTVVSFGVIVGLTITFFLSLISGILLGGNQPPAGQGLPIVGWHLYKDIRPSHFLGVHAQQFIPLLGLFANRYLGDFAFSGLVIGSIIYTLTWTVLTWFSI